MKDVFWTRYGVGYVELEANQVEEEAVQLPPATQVGTAGVGIHVRLPVNLVQLEGKE